MGIINKDGGMGPTGNSQERTELDNIKRQEGPLFHLGSHTQRMIKRRKTTMERENFLLHF